MRSRWKGAYISDELISLYNSKQLKNNQVFCRSSTILESFVGMDVNVHNGLTFYPLHITQEMVGFKFGEFIFTKKTGTFIHKNQLKKQESKKR